MRDIQRPDSNLHILKGVMMVNADCQFNKTSNNLGDKILSMPVKEFLDRVNWEACVGEQA